MTISLWLVELFGKLLATSPLPAWVDALLLEEIKALLESETAKQLERAELEQLIAALQSLADKNPSSQFLATLVAELSALLRALEPALSP